MTRSPETPHPDRRHSTETDRDCEGFELDDNAADFLIRLSSLKPAHCEVDLATVAFEAGRRAGFEGALGNPHEVTLASQHRRNVMRWFSHPVWAVASIVLLVAFVATEVLSQRSTTPDQIATRSDEGEALSTGKATSEDKRSVSEQTTSSQAVAALPDLGGGATNPRYQSRVSFWSSLVSLAIEGFSENASLDPQRMVSTSTPWRAEIYSAQRRRWVTRLVNQPQDAMTRAWEGDQTAFRDRSPNIRNERKTELSMRGFLNDANGSKDLEQWLRTEGF